MFESIRRNWKIAEAKVLRENYVDMLTHISNHGGLTNPDFYNHIGDEMFQLWGRYGMDPYDLSESEKKRIVKSLNKKARTLGPHFFLRGAATSIVSIAIESTYLVGEDAELVQRECGRIVEEAMTRSHNERKQRD